MEVSVIPPVQTEIEKVEISPPGPLSIKHDRPHPWHTNVRVRPGYVSINGDSFTMDEFVEMALYVLVAADLVGPNDPRYNLIRTVKRLHEVPGFEQDARRLEALEIVD